MRHLKAKFLAVAACTLMQIGLPYTVLAQKLQVVSSQATQSSSSSNAGIYFILVLAVVLGAAIAWFIRGRVKISEEEARTGYKPGRAVARPTKFVPKAAILDETRESKRVISALNSVVESTKNDINYCPIFSIRSVPVPPEMRSLPTSDDEAIELAAKNADEEYQPDPEIREDAVAILGTSCSEQAVEALAQVAIYDTSSNLRTLALSRLAEFDHEAVFESVLLACADPTREVRAAASLALSRFSFSRGDQWLRLSQLEDEFLVRQCARAVLAAGLHQAAFNRLINRGRNSVIEALGIVLVLINGQETDEIIDTIATTSDPLVAKALLHAVSLSGDRRAIDELAVAAETVEISAETSTEISKLVNSSITPTDTFTPPVPPNSDTGIAQTTSGM
jgi:hypothetical protein